MLQTDEQLMLSVKDGNRDAFRILTERHYANTLNFIYRFVKKTDRLRKTFVKRRFYGYGAVYQHTAQSQNSEPSFITLPKTSA